MNPACSRELPNMGLLWPTVQQETSEWMGSLKNHQTLINLSLCWVDPGRPKTATYLSARFGWGYHIGTVPGGQNQQCVLIEIRTSDQFGSRTEKLAGPIIVDIQM